MSWIYLGFIVCLLLGAFNIFYLLPIKKKEYNESDTWVLWLLGTQYVEIFL